MKKLPNILLIIMFCMVTVVCSLAQAQCVGEIKEVKMDEVRGSIIVETEYTLNGKVVQEKGRSRYTEDSGTTEEIIAKAKEDIATHCENLIKRIEANRFYINHSRLTLQKALTNPIISSIDKDLIGTKIIKTEAIDKFKGKDIKVTYDSDNSITISSIVPE